MGFKAFFFLVLIGCEKKSNFEEHSPAKEESNTNEFSHCM